MPEATVPKRRGRPPKVRTRDDIAEQIEVRYRQLAEELAMLEQALRALGRKPPA